jgi:Holliday junction DNA helicase RuvA
VELKDKVGDFQAAMSGSAKSSAAALGAGTVLLDALSALVNLGYPDPVAREALARVKKQLGDETFTAMKVEELIREGLRALA